MLLLRFGMAAGKQHQRKSRHEKPEERRQKFSGFHKNQTDWNFLSEISGSEAVYSHALCCQLFLVRLPIRDSLHLFHRKRRKYQVRIVGQKRQRLGLIQGEPKELFLAGEGLAELVDQILSGVLDFSEELSAIVGAESGKGILIESAELVVFDTVSIHIFDFRFEV
jgi:hypothetical protein